MSQDVTKLPRWAQDRMSKLIRERDVAVIALQEFLDSQTKSDIWVERFDSTKSPRMYVQSDRCNFGIGDNSVEISKVGEILQIRCVGSMAETLRVQPVAANTISIWGERFRHK